MAKADPGPSPYRSAKLSTFLLAPLIAPTSLFAHLGGMKTNDAHNLKWLLEAVPEGFLVDAGWMSDNGFGRECIRDFLDNGWLEPLARDVYRRPSIGSRPGVVGWKTCLLSLQHVMGYDVHIGGAVALLTMAYRDRRYHVYRDLPTLVYGKEFPDWLELLSLDMAFETRRKNFFSDPNLGIEDAWYEKWLPWDWTLRMSMPERAILEALDEFPDNLNFPHLDAMFRRMAVMRSELMVELLRGCRKSEVKRLFFVFGDRHDHAWRKNIDPADFDLGTSDLAFLQDGTMHPRYGIAVPPPFAQSGEMR